MTRFLLHSRHAIGAAAFALVLPGCTSDQTMLAPSRVVPQRAVAQSSIAFTVGPLALSGIETFFSGDRWHFRDATLSGPVTGDLTGVSNVTLNANLDGLAGSGTASGSMQIVTTSGDVWQATLTGTFLTGAPEPAIQLFSHMVLHGPDQQTLKVDCNETSASSETLACTGSMNSPHT